MEIRIVKDYGEMSKKAADVVAAQIIEKPDSVLGLATGSTPIGMYKELVRMYEEGIIDFSKVVTFNLDEYVGLDEKNEQSYHFYMMQNLFKHINIDMKNVHILDGNAKDIDKECSNYEGEIEKAGGIDLQILGLGRNGHIGFNEPDVKFPKNTHIVDLSESTIEANSRFFRNAEEVPKQALTMGEATIMKADRIILLANGSAKADAVFGLVKGDIKPELPASALQMHPDAVVIVDKEAASKLEG